MKRFNISILLVAMAAILCPCAVWGDLPEGFPNDPEYDRSEHEDPPGSPFREQWYLFSFEPRKYPGAGVSGISADIAWEYCIGRRDVIIAVLDSGTEWGNPDLANQYYLNRGELPEPQNGDGISTPGVYDYNRDRWFNIEDYVDDPRVYDISEDGIIDPHDLILLFSDGLDDDSNGFIDDICGWDFFEGDNNAMDNVKSQGYSHGYTCIREGASQGNNGIGKTGPAPIISVMPLRVGDFFMADINRVGMAALYAAQMRSNVLSCALATYNNSSFGAEAIRYAYQHGVLTIAGSGDEGAFHHHYPAIYDKAVMISGIVPDNLHVEDSLPTTTYINNSNFSNWGAHLHLSVPHTSTSYSTALASGATALVFAYGKDLVDQGELEYELTAGEVKQILCNNTDDINEPYDPQRYPSHEGWDFYHGYGRLNLGKALASMGAGTIPPQADIEWPEWFSIHDPEKKPILEIGGFVSARRAEYFEYSLEYGIGRDPLYFKEFYHSGPIQGELRGTLASLDITSIIFMYHLPPETPFDHMVTIRLKVIDNLGNYAEDKRAMFISHDADLKANCPIYIGASGESSPKLADLNNDGALEIVFGTADGKVCVIRGDGSAQTGWPVSMTPCDAFNGWLDPSGTADWIASFSPELPVSGASIIGAPAVGDINQDRQLEIVIANSAGKVYVFDPVGNVLAGFPVSMDPEFSDPSLRSQEYMVEMAFYSSPALADLDGDEYLEIIISGGDQRLYVWRYDGSSLAGFPVRLYDASEENPQGRRIFSSPAVGDIDGDGVPEIVVGSQEVYGTSCRLYAVRADGSFMPGWPVKPFALYADIVPVIGTGISSSPLLLDIDQDGTLKIAASVVIGTPTIYNYDGSIWRDMNLAPFGAYSDTDDTPSMVVMSNHSAGDLDLDGKLEFISGGTGLRYALSMAFQGIRVTNIHNISAWDTETNRFMPCFPRALEDAQFFVSPAVADIDRDGYPEIIPGTGGYISHAFNHRGIEPAGWPKLNGGWLFASPAIGDVDGDKLLEVVVITREGYLFIWDTRGTMGPTHRPSVHFQEFRGNNYNNGVVSVLTPTPTPQRTPPYTYTPTPYPGNIPQVMVAGYMDTYISSASGGKFTLWAYTGEVPLHLNPTLHVLYQGTVITNLPLIDAVNGVFAMGEMSVSPGIPLGCIQLLLRYTDDRELSSFSWPYLPVTN